MAEVLYILFVLIFMSACVAALAAIVLLIAHLFVWIKEV